MSGHFVGVTLRFDYALPDTHRLRLQGHASSRD